MYVPKYHKVENQDEALDYIRHNGFGTLITANGGDLQASHIPFHLHEKGESHYLSCHLAKANLQKKSLSNGQEVLAVFMNTHGYVSSSWYDHVNVPTWNYIAVHVYGKVRLVEGVELLTALRQMVDQYETGRSGRFQLEDMDDKMLQAHVNGLIGYEISISRIKAAHKLSQNRKDHDYKNIVEQLQKEPLTDSHELAEVMKKKREDLFHE